MPAYNRRPTAAVYAKAVTTTLAAAVVAALAFGAAPASAKIVMKIGHPLAKQSGLQKWAEIFKSRIEKRSGGEVEVKIFPSSQLGAIPRMIEGVQLGSIEMVTIPPGFFTGIDQRYSVLAAPGVFDSMALGHRVIHDPEFKKVFWHIGDHKGIKTVSMSCDGPSDYATTKPIHHLSDFNGLKLRVFGSKFEIETLRRLGATGVPMPLSEVVPAIQRKVIDGNKAAITVFVPFHYQPIAKYVFRAKESLICINRVVSLKWFDKLPKKIQTMITEEAAKTDDQIIKFNIGLVNKMYKIWVKGGGVLTELSPAEQNELTQRLSTVAQTVLEGQPEVLKVYNVMKEVAARLRKK